MCSFIIVLDEMGTCSMGEMRNTNKILVGKSEGKIHLEDLGIDGRIILKWILRNRLGGSELD
jgi:hypothetical protein